MARSTNRTAAPADPVAALAAQVAALTELVAALTTGTAAHTLPTAAASKPKRTTKATKGAKVYSWKPWACSKFGIPAIVGASFAYNGKNGTTDHVVTKVDADGTVHSTRA